ncbi:MAG: hypothetical protein GY869_21875 [Planctomycetes bacterium]|nr:hypothetical protein [Planctomycetota bacterium]
MGQITVRNKGLDSRLGLTTEKESELRQFIKENESAWRLFSDASKASYFWYEHDENLPTLELLLPYLSDFRMLGRLGAWRSRLAMQEGRSEEAFEDLMVVMRAGRHLVGKPLLVEHLVGLAMNQSACEGILFILDSAELTADELGGFQKELEKIYPDNYPQVDFRGDKYGFMDAVQRAFTDDGFMGGHLICRDTAGLSNFSVGDTEIQFSNFNNPFTHAGRNSTVAKANEIYEHLDKISHQKPYQLYINKVESLREMLDDLPRKKYRIIHLLIHFSYHNLGNSTYRGKGWYEATVTGLALKRWELEKGRYPEALAELVEGGYLGELADDPYGPGVLSYRREGDDFVLYSWGADFDDDGGMGDLDWGEDASGGDYVFWPIRD